MAFCEQRADFVGETEQQFFLPNAGDFLPDKQSLVKSTPKGRSNLVAPSPTLSKLFKL